jgi:signal transduction histidine kinase
MREGVAIGTIALRRTEAQPFTERQVALLQTFADQAVIAIENVRLFEVEQQRTRELSESLQQQTATAEVLRVISSSPGELEPVFQNLLSNARRLCAADFGLMFQYDGSSFQLMAQLGADPDFVGYLQRGARQRQAQRFIVVVPCLSFDVLQVQVQHDEPLSCRDTDQLTGKVRP